ncbi:MAG TPA: site-2 protease family protein, partial [Phycisphaerae bacterium]|nr:site-2 protease family protein [Phycisphaerae bacterium]
HEIKEFGIGVGPAVAWWRVRGVLCTIRLFPLGGFVRFPGQDASGAPIGFRALGPWKKAAIALSAPATFVLMGWMVSVAFHRADDPLRAFNWLFSQDALSFRNWRGMFLQAISGIHSQTDFLRAAGVIMLGVGILNLLPIPSVSGGQALMYLMMARIEQRKALRMESFLQMIGILILLAIAVFTWSALAGALFF